MSKTNLRFTVRKLAAPALFALACALTAPVAGAQETATAKPAEARPASATTPSAEPLFKGYKGVSLGLSADEVRAKLGKPEEKSDEMDFFVFSGRERARVYMEGLAAMRSEWGIQPRQSGRRRS